MDGIDHRITKFIRRHHVMTLATVGESGPWSGPWCANIFYAYMPDENMFVFTTAHDTRHGMQGLANSQVAASIVLETKVVGRIRGLQIAGRMIPRERMDSSVAAQARKVYLRRFPFAAAMELDLWILRPQHYKYTDNTLGFGKKLEWEVSEVSPRL